MSETFIYKGYVSSIVRCSDRRFVWAGTTRFSDKEIYYSYSRTYDGVKNDIIREIDKHIEET